MNESKGGPGSTGAPRPPSTPLPEDQQLFTPDNPFVEETVTFAHGEEPLSDYEPVDCPGCTGDPSEHPLPPVDAPVDLEAARKAVQAENIRMLNGLAQQGMEFDPPLLTLQLKTRLDMLTELVAPTGTELRAAYELSYEQQIHAMLENAVRGAARAKLLGS